MENSVFGRLPAELRDAVYELVIRQPGPVTLRHDAQLRKFVPGDDATAMPNMFAITRVCRAFRAECSALVYSCNQFRFPAPPDQKKCDGFSSRRPFKGLDAFIALLPAAHSLLLQPTLVRSGPYIACRKCNKLYLERDHDDARDKFAGLRSLHVRIEYPYVGAPSGLGVSRVYVLDIDMRDAVASCEAAIVALRQEVAAAGTPMGQAGLGVLLWDLRRWKKMIS
ncbi:hypothetical protein LTR53_006482 [Teratosphaeriaceae sp. CCFEE 6253]|nr:hypothetical protein LTR53_006482 [Teratosphaeriaceae sp. CCFEE 6253]